ncbi:hypothetical protein E4U53_003873 [Claviceps sorghi]|nr:hypothetical protein E4U53_003873 [Claviceps sorghi]
MVLNTAQPQKSAKTGIQFSSTLFPPSPPSTISKSRKNSIDCTSEDLSTLSFPTAEKEDYPPYPLAPQTIPTLVLEEDLKTPDRHVERDRRLIRLTGTHPFNCEPPLSALYNEGFLTSENLHYVRNHGAVPRCDDDDMDSWTFSVEGLVDHPFTCSVRQLIDEYEQLTYPITLVCAGNRRKEQNAVRKSKGFSWGAGGVSTALWTGVVLRNLLSQAQPRRGARFVCFEGADQLPNGHYGTSVKLNWCQDPNRGILIAHKMNGSPLHPDHGKPVRVVIPGQIGGRSVKWLKRIIVTESPSDNWYHIYDNRVLPTMVTPEASADLPNMWKDERYAIYDLNTNSAICFPAHEETIPLGDGASSYKVRGYAYAGGGKRISRMEVTLDQGRTWRLADIDYPEDLYRLAADGESLHGGKIDMWWRETSFCWCFWKIDIAIEELRAARDIMARAMDESLMVQPRDMYWNALGMMNNPWFRVVVHDLGHALRFEHPTQPDRKQPPGWMERVREAGGDLSNGAWESNRRGREEAKAPAQDPVQICMTNPKVDRLVTSQDLKQHLGEDSPWFIISNQVYDGRPFLEKHPGGAASISGAAGQDVTEEFLAIHSENAKAMMPDYHIGRLEASAPAEPADGGAACDASRAIFLDATKWTRAVLHEKLAVSSDSKIFRFRLHHHDQTLGLPPGQHLLMRLGDAGREPLIRAYTPISDAKEKGRVDLLIKIYSDAPPHEGGRMTRALDSVGPGHPVDFKGPMGKFEYLGHGVCSISGTTRHARRFVMICAGSGITPMYQVLRAVTGATDDPTQCLLLDGNRTEDDILCRLPLDEMVSRAPQRCRLVHCLSRPPPSWQGRRGRIDKEVVAAEVGWRRPTSQDLVLLCGPPAMEKSVWSILVELGWKDGDIVIL